MTGEPKKEPSKSKLDVELDGELEGTFPASDPLKITRSKPEHPVTPKPKISRRKTKQ